MSASFMLQAFARTGKALSGHSPFNGLFKYQNGRFTNYLVDSSSKEAMANSASDMVQVADNKYLVICQNFPYWFDRTRFSVFDPGYRLLKTKANGVTQLPDKTIVLATDNGIFLYRSQTVMAQLIVMGIEPTRLTSKGFGDSKPLDGNISLEGKANNRRVEFLKM